MWQWFDEDLVEPVFANTSTIGERFAWWEVMVERLIEIEGYVSLT
jgi:hypothetical protein